MGHYSTAHTTDYLIEFSKKAVDSILEFKSNKRGEVIPVLMYSGFSGSALGIAVSIAYYTMTRHAIPQMYVRKPREASHGSPVESNDYDLLYDVFRHNTKTFQLKKKKILPIFVDDFVESGKTREYTVGRVSKYLSDSVQSLFREGTRPSDLKKYFYPVHDCFQSNGRLVLSECDIKLSIDRE